MANIGGMVIVESTPIVLNTNVLLQNGLGIYETFDGPLDQYVFGAATAARAQVLTFPNAPVGVNGNAPDVWIIPGRGRGVGSSGSLQIHAGAEDNVSPFTGLQEYGEVVRFYCTTAAIPILGFPGVSHGPNGDFAAGRIRMPYTTAPGTAAIGINTADYGYRALYFTGGANAGMTVDVGTANFDMSFGDGTIAAHLTSASGKFGLSCAQAAELTLGTNNANFWKLDSVAGHFLAVTDGGVTLGAVSANRPSLVSVTTSYYVAGIKVVGAQGTAVADATDAATAITQLNLLLARVRTHGLIAT